MPAGLPLDSLQDLSENQLGMINPFQLKNELLTPVEDLSLQAICKIL